MDTIQVGETGLDGLVISFAKWSEGWDQNQICLVVVSGCWGACSFVLSYTGFQKRSCRKIKHIPLSFSN